MKKIYLFIISLFILFLFVSTVFASEGFNCEKVKGKKYIYTTGSSSKTYITRTSIRVSKIESVAISYNKKGIELSNKGYFQDAIIYFKRAINTVPNNKRLCPTFYNNLGITYEKIKKYDLAEQYYRQSINLNPEDAGSLNNLGMLYFLNTKKDYDKSIECFQKAIELKPENSSYYLGLAKSYECKGLYDLAKDNYIKAIKYNSNNYNLYEDLAELYYNNIKDYNKAIEYYQKAKLLNKNNYEYDVYINDIINRLYALKNNPNFEIASSNNIINNIPEKTSNLTEDSIKEKPLPPLIYSNEANSEKKLVPNPIASPVLSVCYKKHTDLTQINYKKIADDYSKEGYYSVAINYYKMALEAEPNNDYIYTNMARTYLYRSKYKLNNQNENDIKLAKECLDKALYINPNNLEVSQILEDLQKN